MKLINVIDLAQAGQASPVEFTPTKDGTLRFSVDYWKLNDIAVRDLYSLSSMDECIDTLKDAQVFSTLEADSGTWEIEVDRADWKKSSITLHFGLFQFKKKSSLVWKMASRHSNASWIIYYSALYGILHWKILTISVSSSEV